MDYNKFSTPDLQALLDGNLQAMSTAGLQMLLNDTPEQANQRERIGKGQQLRIGPWNTGVEMPQGVTEFLAGMGRRFEDIGTLGGALGGEQDPVTNALLDESGYATAGGIGADVATMALGGAPRSVLGATSLAGGYTGATTRGDTKERLQQAGVASLLGGAGAAVPKMVGGLLNPKMQAGARDLLDEGVNLTPGQALGGTVQRIENAATSIPIVGDKIMKARRGGLLGYNSKVVDDALALSGTGKVGAGVKAGHDTITKATQKLSEQYDEVLEAMPISIDDDVLTSLSRLDDLTIGLPEPQANAFNKWVDHYVTKQLVNGDGISGKAHKKIVTDLRKKIGKYKNASGSEADMRDAYQEVLVSVKDIAKRQNPNQAPILDSLDKSYAALSKVKGAAKKGDGGVVTPNQLLMEIKKGASDTTLSQGRGFGQLDTENAKQIFGQMADSGTTGRALVGGMVGGAGIIDPSMLIGPASMYGLYTKPAQEAFRKFAMNPALNNVGANISGMSKYGGLLGSALGANQ